MTVITASPAETQAFADALAAKLPGGTYLAFRGGLGVGKTTFCHGLARGLGCVDEVSSPTFSIVNYYRGPRPLAHFDMYRISSRDDLETTGYFDYLEAGAILAVEWSENIAAALPPDTVYVTIQRIDDTTRRIWIGDRPI